jgi:hypothetical protein
MNNAAATDAAAAGTTAGPGFTFTPGVNALRPVSPMPPTHAPFGYGWIDARGVPHAHTTLAGPTLAPIGTPASQQQWHQAPVESMTAAPDMHQLPRHIEESVLHPHTPMYPPAYLYVRAVASCRHVI